MRNTVRNKLLSMVSLALVLVMCFTGCAALEELTSSSSAPEYEENLTFASVEEMVEYAGDNRKIDPRFHSIMDDSGKITVYELKYMPKGYTLRDIRLEGTVLTFTYLNDENNEKRPITAMWNLGAVGDGRTMMREFVKDHKTLARANKNIDVFYIETEKTEELVSGRMVYFEQADIMFTLYMPKKQFNNFKKKRDRLVNPMNVNVYHYSGAETTE